MTFALRTIHRTVIMATITIASLNPEPIIR
jgi:hypothetical protein